MALRIATIDLRFILLAMFAPLCVLIPSDGIGEAGQAYLYYEEGLSSFHAGDIKEAKIYVKNSLLEDPKQISAHILLSKIHLEEGDGKLAEKELTIADRLGASKTLTVLPLARSLIMQKKFLELVETVFPTYTSVSTDADVYMLRAEAYLELEKFGDAMRAYEQALELSPESIAPRIGKAMVMLRRGNLEEAEVETTEAIRLNSKDVGARFAVASIYHAQGRLQDALAEYDEVLGLQQDHLAAQVAKMGILMDLGRTDEAVALAESVKKSSPEDPRILYLLAVALSAGGDHAGAQAALEAAAEVLKRYPDHILGTHPQTTMLAGLVFYSLKQWEKALVFLGIYIRMYPKEPGPRKLLGSILLAKGEIDNAIDILEPALHQAPGDVSLLRLLGEAYSRANQPVRAADLLSEAVSLAPSDPDARTRRAINSLARGDLGSAIDDLNIASADDPASERAGINLIIAYMRQRDFPAAVQAAQRLVDHAPDSIIWRNLLASAQAYSGNLDAAKENYDRILAMHPDFRPAQVNLGKLDLLRGQPEKAEQRYTRLLRNTPKDAVLMTELARVKRIRGKNEEAIRLLRNAVNANANQLDAAVLLTDLLIETGHPESALKAAQRAEVLAPRDLRVLEALGRSYLAVGEKADAKSVFSKMSGIAGYDADRLYTTAKLLMKADHIKGAIWSLQKATEQSPSHMEAQVLLVKLLVDDARYDAAVKRAQELAERFPQSPVGPVLLADLAMDKKRYADAQAQYQIARDLNVGVVATLGASRAHIGSGRIQTAHQELLQARTSAPQDLRIRQELAELAIKDRKLDLAIAEYEFILTQDPDHFVALNNLAYLYNEKADPRALEMAERALSIDSGKASVNDTLGWILVRHGRFAEALKYLRNAAALAPDIAEIRYHIAVALQESGRLSEAKRELELALSSEQENEWSADAAARLEKLK